MRPASRRADRCCEIALGVCRRRESSVVVCGGFPGFEARLSDGALRGTAEVASVEVKDHERSAPTR
jgi:hypothetical protein